MAGKARTGSGRNWPRVLAGIVLVVGIAGAWGWWTLRRWQPARGMFPSQGVELSAEDGTLAWRSLRAIGADFVYLDVSAGAFGRERGLSAGLEQARAAGLRAGVVHRYDPCAPAGPQAANFVTLVPRDAALLPAAIELSRLGDDCAMPVSDAAVESELMTFVNQIETHTGKPVLLKLSPAFERRYHIAARFDRPLWLAGDWFQPDYAGRPWALWTANHALMTQAADVPLRWVVVQP